MARNSPITSVTAVVVMAKAVSSPNRVSCPKRWCRLKTETPWNDQQDAREVGDLRGLAPHSIAEIPQQAHQECSQPHPQSDSGRWDEELVAEPGAVDGETSGNEDG